MTTYLAFLRAINVGKRRVKMADLRLLFEKMDLEDVKTYLASGNVRFETRRFESGRRSPSQLENDIAAHLEKELGYRVDTFVRTAAEMGEVAAGVPFSEEDEEQAHGVYVGFLREEPDAEARQAVEALRSEHHLIEIKGRELYWLARITQADSDLSNAAFEKALGVPATLRNVKTVRKIADDLKRK